MYSRLRIISVAQNIGHRVSNRANKAFQTDKAAVSHLLQRAQELRHNNFAPEQRRYAASSDPALDSSPLNNVT